LGTNGQTNAMNVLKAKENTIYLIPGLIAKEKKRKLFQTNFQKSRKPSNDMKV